MALYFRSIRGINKPVYFINRKYGRSLCSIIMRGTVISSTEHEVHSDRKNGCRIIKISVVAFRPSSFLEKKKAPDILTGKFFRVLSHVVKEIGNIVFVAFNRTFFKVTDFSGFLKAVINIFRT